MFPLYRAEQIKRSEPVAAQTVGISMYELMERAGFAAFERLKQMAEPGTHILVCCGSGNNGGDGFVVARQAAIEGYSVTLFQPKFCHSSTDDSSHAKQSWLNIGGNIESEFPNGEFELIVDGLLGTGLSGAVREEMLYVIRRINALQSKVLSLDVPSGLQADTGVMLGGCVRADTTVSFIGAKTGLVTGRAKAVVGELFIAELGVGEAFADLERPVASIFDKPQALEVLPKRGECFHKGESGRATLVGGAAGFSGAIILASQACARSGAGLVSVISSEQTQAPLLSRQPEIMVHSYDSGDLSESLIERVERCNALAVGPGLGQGEWGKKLLKLTFKQNQISKVFDADALNLIANMDSVPDLTGSIITPHPGEASRLLGISIQEVESDRYAAARRLYEKYHAITLLKGSGTIIYNGKEKFVIRAGNPGMASGGMGDVLTGILVALLAQGLGTTEAATLGAWLHSSAADRVAADGGKIGILASDLLPHIRELMNLEGDLPRSS
ncbi:NAD(P)HX epimerase [Vibrio ishigakensis]|uniref:Bifunctional NAD(P)H-hydrate repair enzyme n=1 Tax=Vibrio ishigakensis TaxID=1481914 RepID=A0A0B8QJH5_9VIBR|nr:NAD(P)HX epimerase [Vibrio ishigakensis]